HHCPHYRRTRHRGRRDRAGRDPGLLRNPAPGRAAGRRVHRRRPAHRPPHLTPDAAMRGRVHLAGTAPRPSHLRGRGAALLNPDAKEATMPTFHDPAADAREAAEALRGLTHATITIDDPRAMYEVIGNLLAGTRYLAQVTDQLAQNQHRSAARATTDHGDPLAARTLISDTIDALRTASARMDQAEVSLDQASWKAGQIAWKPDDPQHRWVSIVFLQGEDADPVMEIIDRQATDAAIAHLAGCDDGAETVGEAMEHEDVC